LTSSEKKPTILQSILLKGKDMEKEKTGNNVSYFAFDGAMAMMERTNHRQFIVIIVLILALIATNTAWILYEAQWEVYEESTVTQDVKSGNGNAVVTGTGDITYGESEADSSN